MRHAALVAAGLAVGAVAAGGWPAALGADAAAKKIVFLWSKGHHPNEPACILFKHCLENSPNVKGITCEVHERWPAEAKALDDAACIVIYSEGNNKAGVPHPVLTAERIPALDALAARGVGIVLIHYALYGSREVEAPKQLAWCGAYYDFQGYGSKHGVSRKPLVCTPATPDHPVSRGWKEFTLNENEMYHKLKFTEDPKPAPILTCHLSGGPQVVAWALERQDGGRGFGFGDGHFYSAWLLEDCRKMILNGIVWAANIEVPPEGVQTTVPPDLKTPKAGKH
jgi:type 1 glutamine amidotransferase